MPPELANTHTAAVPVDAGRIADERQGAVGGQRDALAEAAFVRVVAALAAVRLRGSTAHCGPERVKIHAEPAVELGDGRRPAPCCRRPTAPRLRRTRIRRLLRRILRRILRLLGRPRRRATVSSPCSCHSNPACDSDATRWKIHAAPCDPFACGAPTISVLPSADSAALVPKRASTPPPASLAPFWTSGSIGQRGLRARPARQQRQRRGQAQDQHSDQRRAQRSRSPARGRRRRVAFDAAIRRSKRTLGPSSIALRSRASPALLQRRRLTDLHGVAPRAVSQRKVNAI